MAWHKRDFAKLFAKASIFGIAMVAGITNVSADLLLYYDFNTPGTTDEVPDVSGKGNNGLRMGTEYTGPGGGRTGAANDRAMDFLTSADAAYVDIPSAGDGAFDSITDKDAFTISVWLKGSDELPADGTVLWFAGGNERQIIAHVPWSDSVIYFDMAGCDSCLFQEETDPTKFKGQWNHYAFVKNGEKAAVYQNGKVWIETEGRTPMDSITTARFGTFARDTYPYSGLMDDIAIWNEALTDKVIAGLAAGDSPIGGGLKGDFNGDKKLDVLDIDALTVEVLSAKNTLKYDVNNDKLVTDADRGVWVRDLRRTYFGDANLDGVFSSSDFVLVFQTGKYEDTTPRNAGWADGDWNGDADFTSGDFVTAFQDGGFEKGPRAAVSAVPEPSAVALLGLGMAALITRRRRSR